MVQLLGNGGERLVSPRAVVHTLEICGGCRSFDMDILLPNCTGRVRTCRGPFGRLSFGRLSPEIVRAKKLARSARKGTVALIGGTAAR